MNIKIIAALVLFIQIPNIGFTQKKATVNSDVAQLISKQKSGEDSVEYSDSTYGYKLIVPKWWTIKETPSANFFGGTFPELATSESALLFKAFEKEKFKSLQNFENWVITGYKSGDTPKWSTDQKILYKKNLSEFSKIGKAFKVQLMADGTFYNACYILVETSSSFLWIDLTTTRETYDANFKKLESIMEKFMIL